MSDPVVEGAEVPVEVTVLHGAFDSASYALMIGVYADEEMSGAERFLDHQFDELLSGWRDIGRYSGALGTSVFVEPARDVVAGCEPVGAYLVGLGSTLSLSRQQVAFAVQRALVDRCVRLYANPTGKPSDLVLVGVSSALLGVRNDDGLRVEDAVIGVLEGVRDANRLLARFEQGRSGGDGSRSCVRVGFVEFVERYADRANLAAAAVRQAGPVAGLPANFGKLEQVNVTSGDGALPAGASFLESDRTWRRFIITEHQTLGESPGESPGRSLVVDVSMLGRDAQADRLTHRIDRASLDSLVARVAQDRDDVAALRTLRDRLVPNAMRAQFLTTSAIQLIVDASTANYPWELLAASAVSAPDQTSATGTGAVLRMFTETESKRLQPVRARVGTALVIGAGNVDDFPPIPGVIEEADEVARLLTERGIDTSKMIDRDGSLDVAELNIALYGDRQILHIASHGVHTEGDPDTTGAILNKDLRFTADMAASLPTVPELVFLNCCDIGRIGQHRLAAGLARELMALGVRAVVAAAWPVGDKAAKAFASTFYTELTSGRTLGDAVTKARTRCAEAGAGKTWAAYQCYGDPTFVLRGRSAEVSTGGPPVSLSDLHARLGTLLTQIADLSQPKYQDLKGRRQRLSEDRTVLADWAERNDHGDDLDVRRLLARTARELGDFEAAATCYGRFAKDLESGSSRLGSKVSSPFDLQQAANCLARAAQERARSGPRSDEALREELAKFLHAVALAEGAIEALPEDESHSILASVHKKWATVDHEHRAQHLQDAVDAYGKLSSRRRGAYGVENWIQLMAIVDRPGAQQLLGEIEAPAAGEAADAEAADVDSEPAPEPAPAPEPTPAPRPKVVDAAPPRGADFWARAATGDSALSQLMVATTDDDRQEWAGKMVERYERAFKSRSTFSERASAVDHLQDLHDLLPVDDERRPFLAEALDVLGPWRLFAKADAEPDPETTTEGAPSDETPRQATPTVKLTASPAACGDCLMLDYAGDDGEHRILIDGGLGSTFERGLGSLLGPPESQTAVDVAVVTHVDMDHIQGMIRALEERRLDAGDIWFNGRDQLEQLFAPEGTRGVRQGDALSELIPDEKRNAARGGEAFVLPAAGPPPTIPLPGGATAVLLSPTQKRLERLLRKWPEPSRGNGGHESLEELAAAFDEDGDRGVGQFGRDSSVANGSSIAFLFEHQGVSILFAADAFAAELEASIRALLEQRNESKLHVWLFKLPHHGSRQNLTDDLLDLIEPESILVCTDGSKFKHPDEDALDKLREHYPSVPIHFTDDTELIRDRAAHVNGFLPPAQPLVIRP